MIHWAQVNASGELIKWGASKEVDANNQILEPGCTQITRPTEVTGFGNWLYDSNSNSWSDGVSTYILVDETWVLQ